MSETLRCPFCGGTDIGIKDSVIEEECHAYCRHCFATGPKVHISEDSSINDEEVMSLAIAAWNKRVSAQTNGKS